MIPVHHIIELSLILFTLGISGLICRSNMFFTLIGLELMAISSIILFVIADKLWNKLDGQTIYIILISIIASESSIMIAMIIKLYQKYKTYDIDYFNEMKQ